MVQKYTPKVSQGLLNSSFILIMRARDALQSNWLCEFFSSRP